MNLTELLYKLERENAPKEVIDKVKRDIEKIDNYRQLRGLAVSSRLTLLLFQTD